MRHPSKDKNICPGDLRHIALTSSPSPSFARIRRGRWRRLSLALAWLAGAGLPMAGCGVGDFTPPEDPFIPAELDENPTSLTLNEAPQGQARPGLPDNLPGRAISIDGEDSEDIAQAIAPECTLGILANPNTIQAADGGLRVVGSLFAADENSEKGHYVLSQGDFFVGISDVTGDVFGLSGFGSFRIPDVPGLSHLSFDDLGGGAIGYAPGDHPALEDFRGIDTERCYFFGRSASPLSLSVGKIGVAVGGFAVDPSDPMVMLIGDTQGLPIGPVREAVLGFSSKGLLSFEPLVSAHPDIAPFQGELLVAGVVQLPALPPLDGEMVINYGDGGSEAFFDPEIPESFVMGFNGTALLDRSTFPLLPPGVELEMGEATFQVVVESSGDTRALFAGTRTDPVTSIEEFLGSALGDFDGILDILTPLESTETIYGTLSSNPADLSLGVAVDASMGFDPITLDFSPIVLELNADGLALSGQTRFLGQNIAVTGSADENGDVVFTGTADLGHSDRFAGVSFGFGIDLDLRFALEGGQPQITASGSASAEVAGARISVPAPSINIDIPGRKIEVGVRFGCLARLPVVGTCIADLGTARVSFPF